MTISFLSSNKFLKYVIMIIVSLFLSLVCLNGINAKEMQIESSFAEINDTKIYYEVMGEGHPLVLIHGGFMDIRMWDNEFELLAKYFKVIRYDLRGYGKSAVPNKTFSHIDDLFHLLKYLKIDKTYILGLSLGSMVAIDFTLTHPDMVDALIPVAPSIIGYYPASDAEIDDLKRIVSKYSEIFKTKKEEGLDKAAELVMKLPFFVPVEPDATITQKMHTMIKDNFENWSKLQHLYVWSSPPSIQRLSEIKIPVFVIAGDHDVKITLGVADTLVTTIAGAKKQIIHGAAHHVNMEKPDEFNSVVLEFLKGI